MFPASWLPSSAEPSEAQVHADHPDCRSACRQSASAISTRFAELTVPLTFLPTSIDAQSSTAIRARAAAAQNRNVGVRALEHQEFIFRDYKPTIPPAVTYGITKRIKDIQKVLSELEELGKKWQQEDHRAQSKR